MLDPKDKMVVEAIRKIMFEAVPDAEEVIKWGTLMYQKKKIIGGVMVHKNQINLQLWEDARLNDPGGLLEGTGKSMPHVKFVTTADIRKEALKHLLVQAGRFASGAQE